MVYLELMEKWPQFQAKPKNTKEAGKPNIEIVDIKTLVPSDILEGDRAFIHTESGNRYMLRHSKSRNGRLVIYNERQSGFSTESGRPFLTKRGSAAIAEVGQQLEYFSLADENVGSGEPVSTTRVTRIEIRRNLETAAGQAAAKPQGEDGFQNIAQALREAAAPQRRGVPSQRRKNET